MIWTPVQFEVRSFKLSQYEPSTCLLELSIRPVDSAFCYELSLVVRWPCHADNRGGKKSSSFLRCSATIRRVPKHVDDHKGGFLCMVGEDHRQSCKEIATEGPCSHSNPPQCRRQPASPWVTHFFKRSILWKLAFSLKGNMSERPQGPTIHGPFSFEEINIIRDFDHFRHPVKGQLSRGLQRFLSSIMYSNGLAFRVPPPVLPQRDFFVDLSTGWPCHRQS